MSARHAKAASTRHLFWAVFCRVLLYLCIAAILTLLYAAVIMRDNRRAVCELTLHYEQAASGLTPNNTRLTISELKSEPVLTLALENLGLADVTAQQLAERISISPCEGADGTPSMTRYAVTYEGGLLPDGSALDTAGARAVLRAVLDAYQQTFVQSYLASPAAPVIDWDACGTLEYSEAGRFLAKESARLARFVRGEQAKFGSDLETPSGESFATLERRIANFQAVDLENYNALILQSGLARDSARLAAALQRWSLLQALTGTATTAEQTEENSVLLLKLQACTAAPEDTAKAQQLLRTLQQTLTSICSDAAALHEQAAALRAQQVLTVTDQPGLTEGWHVSWAVMSGAALFCVLCAVGFFRSGKTRCQHEKH